MLLFSNFFSVSLTFFLSTLPTQLVTLSYMSWSMQRILSICLSHDSLLLGSHTVLRRI